MEQLDKWNKEMRRLSVVKFAETDDALYNYYKEALKSLKVEIKQYTDNYDQLSFSKRLEVENRLKTANRIDGILNDLFTTALTEKYLFKSTIKPKPAVNGLMSPSTTSCLILADVLILLNHNAW